VSRRSPFEVRLWFGANFAYIDGRYPDGTTTKLCRLRYGGSAHLWGFAIYEPATTTTKIPTCHPAHPAAPPKKPSTAPAAST